MFLFLDENKKKKRKTDCNTVLFVGVEHRDKSKRFTSI